MGDDMLVIDSDGHVIEPMSLWLDRMPPQYHDRAPRLADETGTRLFFDGQLIPPKGASEHKSLPILEERFRDIKSRGFSADAFVDGLDVEGLDAMVLFPTRGLQLMGFRNDDADFMTSVTRAYNDWISDFCGEHPGRLFGVGMIHPGDPSAAVEEARRCIEELGLVGVFMRPNPVGNRQLHDHAYDALYSELARLDVPLCLHEGGVSSLPQVGTDRFTKHSMWHVCSHPMEQQLAMVSIVLGGVLERHPSLRVGFLECGAGWLPYWMWRMDEQWERDGEEDELGLTMTPSQYVTRQCYIAVDTDETTAQFALETLSGRNVLWGSDFPHPDSKYPVARETLCELSGIKPFVEKILWTNPIEFYGSTLGTALGGER
jgi:predicted TIM-barrel fold metal-dependent hydrolase